MDLNKYQLKQPNESYSDFYSRIGLDVTPDDVEKNKRIYNEYMKKFAKNTPQNKIADLRLRMQRRAKLKKLMSKLEIPKHILKNVFKYVGYDLVESSVVTK